MPLGWRVILAILIKPLVSKDILVLLWHMMVLKGLQAAEALLARDLGLLRLHEVICEVVEGISWVAEVLPSAAISSRLLLLAPPLLLVCASGLWTATICPNIGAAITSFLISGKGSVVSAWTQTRIHHLLPRNLVEALVDHRLRILQQEEIPMVIADHVKLAGEVLGELAHTAL